MDDKKYYFEEDYPDCLGDFYWYNAYPACYTCLWKGECSEIIHAEQFKDISEDKND